VEKRWQAGVVGAVIALALAGVTSAAGASVTGAATAITISRAPYVTDLTTSNAYVDWAIEGQQTAGSVMIQPASAGKCPTSITWNASQEITSPIVDPLVEGSSKTVSWSIKVNGVQEYQAETPVTGLQAGTQYCYAVYSSYSVPTSQLWATQTFTTLDAPSSSAPLTFDVLGDTGETQSASGVEYPNDLNPGEQAIYQEIGNSGAKFLLMAGDVSYSGGTETSYGDLNQKGTDISDIFGPQYLPQAKGIPTFVADGNHGQTTDDLRIWPESDSVAGSNGVYSYGAPPASVDGITNSSPSDWYAIQDGNVRIYVLDASWADNGTGSATGSNCQPVVTDCKQYQADHDEHWTTSSTEYKWLQSDLAAHPGGVKMAVFHYPLQSDNNTQPSDPYLSGLESLLAGNGVQVAFNGHAHTYQRIVPTAPGTVANFVTGGGGGILEPVDSNSDKSGECQKLIAQANVYAVGWSPTTSKGSACSNGNKVSTPTSAMQVFNYLKVTVNSGLVTVTAYNAENQPFDSYTFNYGTQKDTQPPSVPTGLMTTSVTSSSVGLSWSPSTDNVGVAGYDVLRNGAQVGTTSSTSFTDSTVAPNTTYQYSVEAFDAAGNNSGPGPSLPVTTPAGSPPPPPGVTFVQSAQAAGKTVGLTNPSATGDLLTLSASLYTGATNHVTSVTDSAGDTWKMLADGNTSGHNSDGELWYTVTKGPVTNISVATNASSVALSVQEFGGLGAAPTVVAGASSNTSSSASATTSGNGGLAIGFVAGHASNQAITAASSFVNQLQVTTPSPFASLVTGYDLSVPSGSQTYGGTFGAAMYWAAGVAVFTPTS
jgi:chitodextrinase